MFTPEILKQWLRDAARFPGHERLIPWLPGICKLLNAYGSELSVKHSELDVKCMLQQVVGAFGTCATIDAEKLKLKIVESLDTCNAPTDINAFSLEEPSNPHSGAELKQSTTLHQLAKPKEREKISRLRTSTTKANGRKLADAALSLRNQIKWLPRGEEGLLGVSTTTHSHSGRGVNHFSQWLANATDLLQKLRMNCWESVFYTAYTADLVSKGVLRAMFSEAVRVGQVTFGEKNRIALARNKTPETASTAAIDRYVETLYHYLRGDKAIDIIRHEDTPKKGDLVFVGGMSHVCICVGKQQTAASDELVPHVMSLWHHDNEQYTLLPFTELFKSTNSISIHPCPF